VSSPTLTGLLDDAALLPFEHQLHLADVLGEHSYSVDLRGQRLEFTGARPRGPDPGARGEESRAG